jgi:hypothetical protein
MEKQQEETSDTPMGMNTRGSGSDFNSMVLFRRFAFVID